MDTAQTLSLTFKVSPMKKETKLVLQQAHCLKKIPCAYSVVDAGELQHCLQRAGRCKWIELAGQGLFSHYREPSQIEEKRTLGQDLVTYIEKVNKPPEQQQEEEHTQVMGQSVSLTDPVMRGFMKLFNFKSETLVCSPWAVKIPISSRSWVERIGF